MIRRATFPAQMISGERYSREMLLISHGNGLMKLFFIPN
jgi:hypothetical protein